MNRRLRQLEAFARKAEGGPWPGMEREAAELRASRPRRVERVVPAVERASERKASARSLKKQLRRDVREGAMTRSLGTCEVTTCACPAEEMDHFWGRGKVPDSIDTVWMLCRVHHKQKGDGVPSRVWWLQEWRRHAVRYGHHDQIDKARRIISLELAQHPEAAI